MEKITEKEIIREFDNNKDIWPVTDKWHIYTRKQIEAFLSKNIKYISEANSIINAGSSGENYIIPDDKTVHVDLVESRIKSKQKYIVANIENIPLESEKVDLICCLGSTINYATLILAVKEFERLIKSKGYLILEFECSNTLELLFTKDFNASTVLIKTFYRGEETKIWYYSEEWVKQVLKEYGFKIIKQNRWHIVSPFFLKFSSENFCSQFSVLDPLFKRIPWFKRQCSNTILLAQKTKQPSQ